MARNNLLTNSLAPISPLILRLSFVFILVIEIQIIMMSMSKIGKKNLL